jgi:thymidylate synthase (FAD)
MKVELLNSMGGDDTVVNAARVSYDKDANQYDWEENRRLIKYLADHNHWSPFAHAQIQFRIKAPIFIARQLAKHQVGLVWNEVSYRYVEYVESVTAFWEPKEFRKDGKPKQGSCCKKRLSGRRFLKAKEVYDEALNRSIASYEELLHLGVSKEQARAVLPVAIETEWYWTGSLLAFARVCKLRLDPASQAETREVAQEISDQIKVFFPDSWDALIGDLQNDCTSN